MLCLSNPVPTYTKGYLDGQGDRLFLLVKCICNCPHRGLEELGNFIAVWPMVFKALSSKRVHLLNAYPGIFSWPDRMSCAGSLSRMVPNLMY